MTRSEKRAVREQKIKDYEKIILDYMDERLKALVDIETSTELNKWKYILKEGDFKVNELYRTQGNNDRDLVIVAAVRISKRIYELIKNGEVNQNLG